MSLLATPPEEAANPDRGVTIAPVERLEVLHQVRGRGLDERHVAALAELDGQWPPLLVWAERPEAVIDGAHRLAAAKRLGHRTIAVIVFCGSLDDAFVESVHRNVEHGLPLALEDRLRAGRRILRRHPEWSDRRIGDVCALAARTVARVRREVAASAPAPLVVLDPHAGRVQHSGRVQPDARVGKDGRVRPVAPGAVRERIAEALAANPNGSLREIAGAVGASPETVRRVRMGLETRSELPAVRDAGGLPASNRDAWRVDLALTSRADLGELVEWLERTDPGDDPYHYVAGVPLSRVYELGDEARRRAAFWTEVARSLETRARRSSRRRA